MNFNFQSFLCSQSQILVYIIKEHHFRPLIDLVKLDAKICRSFRHKTKARRLVTFCRVLGNVGKEPAVAHQSNEVLASPA